MRLKKGASLVHWVAVVPLALLATLLFVTGSYAQTSSPVSLPVEPPPAKYDHPYKGDVAIVYDLDVETGLWGWTDVSQLKKGICTIHLVPFMTVAYGAILDMDAKTALLRHENAHCNGWRHSGSDSNPASANNVKFKYLLQCGNAKSVPPDNDSDPIVWTRIAAIGGGEIYIRHFAASGENYTRNKQYRDLKFWSEGKADNWSGTSINHPNRTMAGRLQMDKTERWIEYVERLYRGGKLQSTTTSACRFISPDDVVEKSYEQ